MSRLARRAAIGMGLATPWIVRQAHAAEFAWRFGHIAPNDSPFHQRLLEAADAIARRSEGQLTLKVTGEGAAGIPAGLLAQVRNGGLEMTMAGGIQLSQHLAAAALPSIGFLFDDYQAVWKAMDGELGAHIRPQLTALLGFEVLEKIWDFGFHCITTTDRPIRAADDLAGMRLRTQIDEGQMEVLRGLRATPLTLPLNALHGALEHRELNGTEGLLPLVRLARLADVQKYCALTRHGWDGMWICVNSAAWRRLPERLQGVLANTINGLAAKQREDNLKLEQAIQAELTASGMAFNTVEAAGFRQMLIRDGYYGRLRAKHGEAAWSVLRRTTGLDV